MKGRVPAVALAGSVIALALIARCTTESDTGTVSNGAPVPAGPTLASMDTWGGQGHPAQAADAIVQDAGPRTERPIGEMIAELTSAFDVALREYAARNPCEPSTAAHCVELHATGVFEALETHVGPELNSGAFGLRARVAAGLSTAERAELHRTAVTSPHEAERLAVLALLGYDRPSSPPTELLAGVEHAPIAEQVRRLELHGGFPIDEPAFELRVRDLALGGETDLRVRRRALRVLGDPASAGVISEVALQLADDGTVASDLRAALGRCGHQCGTAIVELLRSEEPTRRAAGWESLAQMMPGERRQTLSSVDLAELALDPSTHIARERAYMH